MPQVVPAILTSDPADFGHKIKRLKFAGRVHVDVSQPPFAPTRTIGLAQIHLPDGLKSDLHLMINHPEKQAETVISLNPDLAIVHFEADGNLANFFERIGEVGIKKGLAILPETTVSEAAELIKQADHVLVFTGNLGHYGGELRGDCLAKIAEIKELNPKAEISVDGGVNPDNAAEVARAGADILISGGFIANAEDPKAAFSKIAEAV